MASVQNQREFQYGASYVSIGGSEIPLQSTSVTYLRYARTSVQYEKGFRQGLVFILGEEVNKPQTSARIRDAISGSLSDKLELLDYSGNPLIDRLEIMATNNVELLRKEKS